MNESGERSSRCVRDESVKVRKKTDKYVMSPLECTYEIDCVNPPRGPSAISEEQATKKVRWPRSNGCESTNVSGPAPNGSLLLFMDPTVVLLLVFNSNNRNMSQRLHALIEVEIG